MKLKLLAVAALTAASFTAAAQAPGISKTEITIGSLQDLSGPIASFGKQTRNGLQMRADEINESGGINGRKLKLVVEDHQYDPRRALLATQKLITQDNVFAVLGHIGTPTNLAVMPLQFERGVINFFPLSGAREMFEPFHKLKFSFFPPYFDQMRTLVPQLAKEKSLKRACVMYQDDEFGLEVVRGTEAGLKSAGMQIVERASYKRGSTDFSSQMARLKAADCDLVVLGTIIRETIGAVAEARKSGYNPTFIGSNAVYTHLIHQLGGKAMDGLYGVQIPAHPYADDPSTPVREWAGKYKAKFNEDPTVFSVYGYYIVDTFARAAAKAGANLTTDSFLNAMETTTFPADIFGNPEVKFAKGSRLGQPRARLAQIVNGRWTSASDLVEVVRGD